MPSETEGGLLPSPDTHHQSAVNHARTQALSQVLPRNGDKDRPSGGDPRQGPPPAQDRRSRRSGGHHVQGRHRDPGVLGGQAADRAGEAEVLQRQRGHPRAGGGIRRDGIHRALQRGEEGFRHRRVRDLRAGVRDHAHAGSEGPDPADLGAGQAPGRRDRLDPRMGDVQGRADVGSRLRGVLPLQAGHRPPAVQVPHQRHSRGEHDGGGRPARDLRAHREGRLVHSGVQEHAGPRRGG